MRYLWMMVMLSLSGCMGLDEGIDSYNNPTTQEGGYFTERSWNILNKTWKLEAYESGSVSSRTVLEFKAERTPSGGYVVSGQSAVNFYEASYLLPASNQVRFSSLSMTKVEGTNEAIQFENDFFRRLLAVENFEVNGTKLTLSNGKGEKIIFRSN